MYESAPEGADADESTGRELWQIRPVDPLRRISFRVCSSLTHELEDCPIASDAACKGPA